MFTRAHFSNRALACLIAGGALVLAAGGHNAMAQSSNQALDKDVPSQSSNAQDESNQPVSDTWITTKVKAELATTKDIKSTEISVETVNGVVTLTGVLPSDQAVKKAEAATKSVKGVKSVDVSGLKAKG